MLRWPDAAEVRAALQAWATRQLRDPEIVAVGCFGSFARGDWGVGSDLDLVLLLRHSELPFVGRAAQFDTLDIPVPVDLLVYTEAEWSAAQREGGRLAAEVRWVAGAPGS